jgi:MFS family permease
VREAEVATHIDERAQARTATTRVEDAEVRPYPGYRALWVWLLLGWVASGADRTITGPVVTYMINAKVPIIASADNPFALGGLVGSLLFAGYMLTQFPGGYVGDRLGHRTQRPEDRDAGRGSARRSG